jgi:hypothetical protein
MRTGLELAGARYKKGDWPAIQSLQDWEAIITRVPASLVRLDHLNNGKALGAAVRTRR